MMLMLGRSTFTSFAPRSCRPMDSRGWQTLAMVSPTPGCQATETAVNLAISIARQPDRSVLLVDFNLSESGVASCLGLECDAGVASVLLRSKPLAEGPDPGSDRATIA